MRQRYPNHQSVVVACAAHLTAASSGRLQLLGLIFGLVKRDAKRGADYKLKLRMGSPRGGREVW